MRAPGIVEPTARPCPSGHVLAFLAAAASLTLSACHREAPTPSSAALRFVQTTLRDELRQRWLRVDQPSPDTLRLTFQDEGFRKSTAEQLGTYATAAAHRALGVLAPPPSAPPAALRVVSVRIEHSRRLGPLSWLAHVTTYHVRVPVPSHAGPAPGSAS